jgi:hypothetical protein
VREGARVFNDPRAVRDHNEKLSIAQFSQFTAPTIVTRDPARLRAFAQAHGEAVFKLLDGMGGVSNWQATFPNGCADPSPWPACPWWCDAQHCDPCHPNDNGYHHLAGLVKAGLGL